MSQPQGEATSPKAPSREPGHPSIAFRLRRRWLRYVLPASAVVVVVAGGGLAAVESDTVGSFWEGVWWALSLMTTVGFVGAEPSTVAGRLLSAALMLMGFGLLAMTTAAVASLFVREDEVLEERAVRAFEASVLTELRELREKLDRLEGRLPDS